MRYGIKEILFMFGSWGYVRKVNKKMIYFCLLSYFFFILSFYYFRFNEVFVQINFKHAIFLTIQRTVDVNLKSQENLLDTTFKNENLIIIYLKKCLVSKIHQRKPLNLHSN